MVRADDALDLLLPGAGPPLIARARRIVHFLRLLGDDAQPARAASTGVDLDRARVHLDDEERRRLEGALVDLLRHHLAAVARDESFLWPGEPGLGLQEAWRVLEEHRVEHPWIAGVPEPDESALAVAARLLESLSRIGAEAGDLDPWRGRIARFAQGPRPAEGLFRGRLSATEHVAESAALAPAARRALTAGVAECMLDRGAVREARNWIQEHAALAEGDARLRQLLAWSQLCLGDGAAARGVLVGLPPWSGALPAALVELRERRPEWLPCLAGRSGARTDREQSGSGHRPEGRRGGDVAPGRIGPAIRERGEPSVRERGEPAVRERGEPAVRERGEPAVRERGEIGAIVLAVFAFRPAESARAIAVEAAPALRDRIRAWLEDREGAFAISGEREHDLVVGARTRVCHRTEDAALPGTLGGDAAAALVLAPVLEEDGEVAGWIHAEFEHHLVPSRATLARLAAGWRREILEARGRAPAPETPPRAAAAKARPEPIQPPRPGAEVFRDLVQDLSIKTAQRRWWGFLVSGLEAELAAEGGEAAGLSDRPRGRRRALARSLATGGSVVFEEPDASLAIDERASSGVVLPLRAGGSVCGLLAIESSRRRDFRLQDLQRYQEPLVSAGLALRLARFRAWHRAGFGHDVWFDPRREDFRAFAEHLLGAARARAPVVFCGPPGGGKQVLARWLCFESGAPHGPPRVIGCGSGLARGGIARILSECEGRALLLDDLESLAPEMQEELLRLLERAVHPEGTEAPARILATTRLGLAQAVRSGRLRDDLAQRLDRIQLRVPALRERREDIPPLVECLALRFAQEEGLRAPDFTDAASALLWRQPWEGNVRELESFVYKLVLLCGREPKVGRPTVDARHVLDIAARFSLEVVKRLPSRHPDRSDLLAALRVTRKQGGKPNKTRAAAWLGWDPDTLVSRMQDAGIGDECVPGVPAWREAEPEADGEPDAGPEGPEEGDGPQALHVARGP